MTQKERIADMLKVWKEQLSKDGINNQLNKRANEKEDTKTESNTRSKGHGKEDTSR